MIVGGCLWLHPKANPASSSMAQDRVLFFV
jgi:hypothetical protein